MKITQITNKFSVSDQIQTDDLNELAAGGIEIIVCNRPDNEAANQPSFEEIEKAAELLNISAVHIPFTAGELDADHVDAFLQQVNTGKVIHAYCRTGNRSTMLWNDAKERMGVANQDQSKHLEKEKSVAKPLFDVVVVGAGSAGISTASSLLKRNPQLRIVLIDPSEEHYYQPGWTMVGGGVFSNTSTKRRTQDLVPQHVTWIKQSVTGFNVSESNVILDNGQEVFYQHLVVAPGLKLDWDDIEGLTETLGKNGVTSNYRYDLAPYTWKLVNEIKKGKAIFTQPPMPIKCAGAPQKALYLSADHWFRHETLKDIDIHFYNSGGVLFGVKDYVPALENYMKKYRTDIHYVHTLKKIDGEKKLAWFATKNNDGNESIVETTFDMIHVCPPQCAPDFIKNSSLSDDAGWLDVDPASLRHKSHKNIWGVGDVINAPNAKTMAAARKQVPVVAQNICDVMNNKAPSVSYDGYGSCPLTVERGKIVLAEFGYGGKLLPTFPSWINEGTKPTKLAWFLKVSLLPRVYWMGMLKGREWFASPRKS